MTRPRHGPVVIGYDGSAASDLAVEAAIATLATHRVLVVHVWEPGMALDFVPPSIPAAPLDLRSAIVIDEDLADRAQRLAEFGAQKARTADIEAEGLAVADEVTVAATLTRVARDTDSPAIVVGRHGHRALRDALVGSTTRELLQSAPCPVLVVRGPKDSR